MATPSSILARKIPWTEEPDRLQSMGAQRVGHDWSDWGKYGPRRALFHLPGLSKTGILRFSDLGWKYLHLDLLQQQTTILINQEIISWASGTPRDPPGASAPAKLVPWLLFQITWRRSTSLLSETQFTALKASLALLPSDSVFTFLQGYPKSHVIPRTTQRNRGWGVTALIPTWHKIQI